MARKRLIRARNVPGQLTDGVSEELVNVSFPEKQTLYNGDLTLADADATDPDDPDQSRDACINVTFAECG